MLAVLRCYQNPDGGFFGLEVDIKAPQSNPFATELALLICLQANVPREHCLLQEMVKYLEETQEEDGGWRLSPAIYEHDLAPWYQEWEWPNLDPSCTLAGLLKELGLGSERLHARVERLFTRLARLEDVAANELYGFSRVRSYAYYFLPEWQHQERELYLAGILWWLIRQHLAHTLHDDESFFAFVRHPLQYTAQHLPISLLQARLHQLERGQATDGGWPTSSTSLWRGWVTMQSLLILRAFGRI